MLTNAQPSLIVELHVDPHRLAQILSQPQKTANRGRGNDQSDFSHRPDIARNLSPIRGAINTPAASLANAPILTEHMKSLTRKREAKNEPLTHSRVPSPSKRVYADSTMEIPDREQEPPVKRPRLSSQCEGCHTRHSINLGYWVVGVPPPDQVRDPNFLNSVCVHKLRRGKTMASAMLQNAQRDFSRLQAQYAHLQAQLKFQSDLDASGLQTPEPGSRGQLTLGGPAPAVNGLSMLHVAAQGTRQSLHDIKARDEQAQAYHFFKTRVPQFPDPEINYMINFIFKSGQAHAINTQLMQVQREGISQGKKAGLLEGWEACDQYGAVGSLTNMSEDELRMAISDDCHQRDIAMRDCERLEKMIELVKTGY